jgi:hypothetical protein
MFAILHALGMLVADLFKSRIRLEAENLFLRHQLTIALRLGVIVAIPILACVYRKRHPYWLAEGIAQRRDAIAAILLWPSGLIIQVEQAPCLPLLPTFRQVNQTRTNVINCLRIHQDLRAFFDPDARS